MARFLSISLSLILASLATTSRGSYVITTPKHWIPGHDVVVCAQVTNPRAPEGNLIVSISHTEKVVAPRGDKITPLRDREYVEVTEVFLPPSTIRIPQGSQHVCEKIPTPTINKTRDNSYYYYRSDDLSVTGSIDGVNLNHTGSVRRQVYRRNTIIQPDKEYYQPGQVVQFRILSLGGPLMNVSTEPYPEIYVTTPSRNRIAQWLDVDNSKGLVHLSLQLADEPEQGRYTIHVKTVEQNTAVARFKVEEYVLPRFEVTVEPPKYVLGTDSRLSFKACAKYTFGQPVNGDISWKISNRASRGCLTEIIRNNTISGCSEIEVLASEMKMTDCRVTRVSATATVTEEGTDTHHEGKGEVSVTRRAFEFEELRKDDYMKPNMPYTIKVLAKLPDGTPASGEALEICHGGACSNFTSPADGIITVYLTNQRSRRVVMQGLVTRAVMRISQYSTDVKRFFSPSNSSLLIYAPEESLKCASGQETVYNLPVLYSAVNQSSADVNVQVISRGQIQYWEQHRLALAATKLPFEEEYLLEPFVPSSEDVVSGLVNIPLSLPPTVSPKARVLVWYVRDDGEVVSDVKELTVDKCLPNSVTLNWSVNKTQPGEQANLALVSEPNSICSLGVVDKSVELLSTGTDKFTIDNLFSNLDNYEINRWSNRQVDDYNYCRRQLEKDIESSLGYNYFSDYVDTLHMFDQSGVYVFTDLDLESRPCQKEGTQIDVRFGATPNRGGASGAGHGYSATSSHRSGGDAPRTDFPETWLWDLVVLPSSGVSSEVHTLPDTITEWIGKAVCVHPAKGVGVSEKASIITFKPFFVDLTLPPSVKRGEILPVKISVFNYLENPLPMRVTLEASPEYDIVADPAEDPINNQRISCLAAQDMQVHTIKIRPNVIGQVNITVTAYVEPQDNLPCGSGTPDVSRSDALVRPITVEAEGFLREKSWSKYICAEEVAAGQDDLEMTELSVPSGMVEGSERAWVTAVGDLLAISLQNLGSLIRMPYGCGEQNMLNFAPNIFILQYLKTTRQETPEATQKLLGFMNTGYQRQLLYRHSNGSFSAFGKADDSGSTWLTAFVLKSFAQAQEFILIDKDSLNVTKHWLLQSYGNDTCATSIGKVFNKGLTGGIRGGGSNVPLTAYVLISLLESGVNTSDPVITRAKQCLLSDSSSNSYTLALKTYALALMGDENTPQYIQQLLSQAVVAKNATYWELPDEAWKSSALAVETAGYAILAMMTWNATSYEQDARKVVKWISSQRNGRGGFYSTQDTVVALQALASYESTQYQGDVDVQAQVQAQDFSHSFSIQESNKLLQQLVTLPTLPTNVTFNIVGQGCAVLQTVLRYNDPEPKASEAFSLRVSTRTEPDRYCKTKRLSACAAYLLPDGKSNMAVIEVNLVSGYIPEKEDLKQLLKDNEKVIKRYDIDGSKLSFYIEEFTAEEVCVYFRVVRVVDVEDVKPGSVVVYDYYQPEFSVSKTYNLPAPTQCF